MTSSPSPPPPPPSSCLPPPFGNGSADDIAQALLRHRFDGNERSLTEFLLEVVSCLPSAQAISEELLNGSNDEEEEAEVVESTDQDVSDGFIKDNDNKKSSQSPTSIVTAVEGNNNNSNNSNNNNDAGQGGTEVSFVTPRCKFRCTWQADRMVATDKQNKQIVVEGKGAVVQQMIVFPKPQDCGQSTAVATDMVLLVFSPDANRTIVYKGKKPLTQVCFQLPKELPDNPDCNREYQARCASMTAAEEQRFHTDQWVDVLKNSLLSKDQEGNGSGVVRILHPSSYETAQPSSGTTTTRSDDWQFVSYREDGVSSTTAGMPFVPCYAGTATGHLFPTSAGLLFFKPCRWIGRGTLHSIACHERPGSRYMDLVLQQQHRSSSSSSDDEDDHSDDEERNLETVEFTNIYKGERQGLNHYIQAVLIPAMKRDCEEETDDDDDDRTNSANNSVSTSTNNGDDDDDDKRQGRKRPQRQAKQRAEQINRQEVGDDDYDEEDIEYNVAFDSDNGDDDDDDDESDDDDEGGDFATEDEDEEGGDEESESEDDEVEAEEDTESEDDDDDDDEESLSEKPRKKSRQS